MSVLVIGSFVMDVVTTTNVIPNAGETVLGLKSEIFPGGKGINQAVSAKRLGSSVLMAGALGKDINGDLFIDIMKEENIDYHNVKRVDQSTGLGNIILNNKTAENQIIVIPGANHAYTKENLDDLIDDIKNANVVVTQLEIPLEVTYHIATLCKKYQKKLILNPAPAVALLEDIYSKINYLTPNETELEILTGIKINSKDDAVDASKKLLEKGVENVIVTLGSKGAIWVNKDFIKEHKGFKVKALDTVGAGDTFNGALAYGIDNDLDIDEILKIANRAASISVTRNGAIPSIPTITEVKNRL